MPKKPAPAWKDSTSYTRDEHKIPRTYELKIGSIRVIVTRIHKQEGWYLRCYELGINELLIDVEGILEAKQRALAFVVARARKMSDDLLAAYSSLPAQKVIPKHRGTAKSPCENCGNLTMGNFLEDGWYRCRNCGYPGK